MVVDSTWVKMDIRKKEKEGMNISIKVDFKNYKQIVVK